LIARPTGGVEATTSSSEPANADARPLPHGQGAVRQRALNGDE
jgi:hypothetical protein